MKLGIDAAFNVANAKDRLRDDCDFAPGHEHERRKMECRDQPNAPSVAPEDRIGSGPAVGQ